MFKKRRNVISVIQFYVINETAANPLELLRASKILATAAKKCPPHQCYPSSHGSQTQDSIFHDHGYWRVSIENPFHNLGDSRIFRHTGFFHATPKTQPWNVKMFGMAGIEDSMQSLSRIHKKFSAVAKHPKIRQPNRFSVEEAWTHCRKTVVSCAASILASDIFHVLHWLHN